MDGTKSTQWITVDGGDGFNLEHVGGVRQHREAGGRAHVYLWLPNAEPVTVADHLTREEAGCLTGKINDCIDRGDKRIDAFMLLLEVRKAIQATNEHRAEVHA